MLARLAAGSLFLLGPLAGLHAQTTWSRFLFDEERPLALDGARVAVQLEVEDERAALLSSLGFAARDLTTAVLPGWSFLALPAGARSDADVEALVAELAARGLQVSPVFRGDDGGPVFVTPTLLVAFHPGLSAAEREALAERVTGAGIVERDWAGTPGQYRLRSPHKDGFDVLASANALARRPEVLFAEPDFAFTGRGGYVPNDPSFGSSWGLDNTGQSGGTPDADMDAPEAWDVTMGSAAVQVVVIDVGVQQDHPDLNLSVGSDFTGEGGGGGPVNSCDNHGTPVAGCISETIDNNLGTAGVAPLCPTASARVFISNPACDGSWSTNSSWTVDALGWAVTIGARVTNNSNRYGFTPSAITQKYGTTRASGVVHFASAGNQGNSNITYPALLNTVNAISAMNRFGNKAGFSNFGAGIAYSAPGQDILTTDRTGALGFGGGDYATVFGTSFASPYAAGVAALVLSVSPTLTPDEIECRLRLTADDRGTPGFDTSFGWGSVNARRAVAPGGIARVYGSGVNPAGSLLAFGAPQIGSTYPLFVHNPLGTQGAPSIAAVAVSTGPDRSFPGGTPLLGWGMSGPGAAGELLLSLSPGNPLAVVLATWTGAPVQVDLPFPNDPGLIGRCFYAQGLLIDPAVTFGVRLGLTQAVELLVGP